ncbi:MAG TPA: iron ABC transporter permease [Gemmatimonadaceae bacterium]|nr:iron ABC transporter permease [Gemmatimonadaceae bacterium]
MRPASARRTFWVALVAAVLLAALGGLAVGPVRLTPIEVWDALRGRGTVTAIAIMRDIRAPRVVLAALVGAALAMSGAALQGTMRNPLAEPYLLGVSGGAAVGAVIAVAGGAPFGLVPLGAFAGAVAAVILVLAIARAGGRRPDPRVLLMAGVVVGAFANAVIMIALASAPADSARNALWWMMGSVAGATWVQVGWFTAYGVVSASALLVFAPEIDVLALGDDAAASLGVNVDRAGRRAYVVASLLAAATVAAAGLVGFVGLVVPHLVRARAGNRHRGVIAAAGLAGAALLVVADLAARTLRSPSELPLGAVTALAGVPFFLFQLRRYR